MNPLFKTVRDPRLRRVLESDHAEFQLARENGMSKAAIVLAGGIIEAVLIDFLDAVEYTLPPKGTDPKNMRLADLIVACEEQGALTTETAALCSIVKEYRNLVHPGRSVRNEQPVNESRAAIVEGLVEHVAREIAERAAKRPEWAAEAIIEMMMDEHLAEFDIALAREVAKLPPAEAVRLVVEVLPNRYAAEMANKSDDEDWMVTTQVTWACLREGLKVIPAPARADAARRLIRELSRASGTASDWLSAFFASDLMAALDGQERRELFSYVLQSLWSLEDPAFAYDLGGVGTLLTPGEAAGLVGALADKVAIDGLGDWPAKTLVDEMPRLPEDAVESAREAMDAAIERWAGRGDAAARLSVLRYRIWPLEDDDIPR